MLGAALLARTPLETHTRAGVNPCFCRVTGNGVQLREAATWTGQWWYTGAGPHWVDNFHTGYNLDSLKCYSEHSDDDSCGTLSKGLDFYKQHFFDERGRPGYYHNRIQPMQAGATRSRPWRASPRTSTQSA